MREDQERAETDLDRRQREAVDNDAYANAVITVLWEDFPALSDPDFQSIVRKHVYANARVPGALEVILDDPGRACWRLVGAAQDRRRVHLGCWKLNLSEADQERVSRLNTALDALITTQQAAGILGRVRYGRQRS